MTPSEILAWRKDERARLITARVAMPDDERDKKTARIIAQLEPIVMAVEGPVSVYWPFRGEPNLRPLMRRRAAAGLPVALPVVVQQKRPLEFRPWTPGCDMEFGVWNIPVPKTDERVTPRLLLAPVVGFDRAPYRLGYGGGFFDRTLAALRGARSVIGVGFDSQEIPTIHPLPHDIPMDRIVTESGIIESREASAELSSPACSLVEAPDAYAGYLNDDEIGAELRTLRASSDLQDVALMRALDRVIGGLPSVPGSATTGGEKTSLVDRLSQLRARVRDDALHAALGQVLELARGAEKK